MSVGPDAFFGCGAQSSTSSDMISARFVSIIATLRKGGRGRTCIHLAPGMRRGAAAKLYGLHCQREPIPLLQARTLPKSQRLSHNSTGKNNKVAIIYCQRRLLRIPYRRLQRVRNGNSGPRPGQCRTRGLTKSAGSVMLFFAERPSSTDVLPCEVRRRLIESALADTKTTVFGAVITGLCRVYFCVPDPLRRPGGRCFPRALHHPRPRASDPGLSSNAPDRRPEATPIDRARPDSRRRQHTSLRRISDGCHLLGFR